MPIGKILMVAGLILLIVGVAFHYSDRIPFLGKLPGDITIERGNTKIYLPIATSILLSILLSLILMVIGKLRG